MAWGNFIVLPCPYKKWDGKLKNLMLAFLPAVGAVIGLLWMALYWVLMQLDIPLLLICLLYTSLDFCKLHKSEQR